MKALRLISAVAGVGAFASFEAAMWTSGDLQSRLGIQGCVLISVSILLGIPAWLP